MSDIIKRIEKALKDMPLDSPSYASVLSLDKIDIYDALNELKTSQQTIKQQAERIEKLEAVVEILSQLEREVRHAQDFGASWYTKGSKGLFMQVRMWLDKSREALTALDKESDDGGK